MRVPLLAIAAASFSFADTAFGQDGNGAAQCQALQQKAPHAVAFIVYPGATDPISRDEFAPTQLQSTGNVAFRVCVPINPQQDGTRGAVNVKIQVYSSAPNAGANAAKYRAVEYENNTDRYAAALATFRKRRASSTAYPSLDIQDYQNYHGCTQPRHHAIGSEFHLQVGAAGPTTIHIARDLSFVVTFSRPATCRPWWRNFLASYPPSGRRSPALRALRS